MSSIKVSLDLKICSLHYSYKNLYSPPVLLETPIQWISNLLPLVIQVVPGSSRGSIPEQGEQIMMKNKIRIRG